MKVKTLLCAGILAVSGIVGTMALSTQTAQAKFNADDTKNGCPATSVYAQNKSKYKTPPTTAAGCNVLPDETNGDLMTRLNTIINVVVGLVGFVAVAVIVIGGITFATSQGDTAKTARGKNTILFGVVGLIIALLAFAIVNFVLKSVFSTS